VQRYTPEIGEALVRTGDAEWLYYTSKEWSNERYITPITDALIQTGNAEYLAKAGKKRYVSFKNRHRGLDVARADCDNVYEKHLLLEVN